MSIHALTNLIFTNKFRGRRCGASTEENLEEVDGLNIYIEVMKNTIKKENVYV